MKKRISGLLFIAAAILSIISCSQSPTTVAGGSDDHGNALIAGKAVHQNGTAAPNTQVLLLSSDYIPGYSVLPAGRTDTTDATGAFKFKDIPDGSYNVQLSNDSAGTMAMTQAVQAAGKPITLTVDTLQAPGVLRISTSILPDASVSVFIPGTMLRAAITPADMAQGYFLIDSVPASFISQLKTLSPSNVAVNVPLAAPCQVTPADTALVQPKPVYRISKTGTAITVDGNLAEFAGVPPVLLSDTIGGRAEYRMLYDDSALYIGVKIYDRYINAGTWVMSKEDCIELIFDTHHDKAIHPQTDDFKLFANARNARLGKEGNGLMFDTLGTYPCSTATVISGTVNNNADIDSFYIMEIALPWSSLQMASPPASGDTLGLDLVLNDRNTAVLLDRNWTVWANTNGDEVVDDTATGCDGTPGNECCTFNDPIGFGELILGQ